VRHENLNSLLTIPGRTNQLRSTAAPPENEFYARSRAVFPRRFPFAIPDAGQRGQGATEPRLLYTSVEFSRKLTAMLPKHRKKNALRAEK
jgi:hypothetical protein